MPITEHADTAPAALAADLRRIRGVDWAGLADRADTDLEARLAEFGWDLAAADPAPALRSPEGAVYDLDGDDRTLSHWAWRAQAGDPRENAALFRAAADVWPEYLDAAGRALGAPDAQHDWDDPGFPPVYHWTDPDSRRRERSPYRLARWDLGAGRLLLWVNVLRGTAAGRRPGTVAIVVTLLLPDGG